MGRKRWGKVNTRRRETRKEGRCSKARRARKGKEKNGGERRAVKREGKEERRSRKE